MKWFIIYFTGFFLAGNCTRDSVFEFGVNEGEEVSKIVGSIGPTVDERRTVVPYSLPPCTKMSHVTVMVQNPRWRPSVSVNAVQQQVVINYRYNHNSQSTYKISVKAITDTNCTSTSNVDDNPKEETNNYKTDGEFVDYDDDNNQEKADVSGEKPSDESALDPKTSDENGQVSEPSDESEQDTI